MTMHREEPNRDLCLETWVFMLGYAYRRINLQKKPAQLGG
jgi:hypothetical protein